MVVVFDCMFMILFVFDFRKIVRDWFSTGEDMCVFR